MRETLTAGRWPIVELVVADDLDRTLRVQIQELAPARRIPVRTEPRSVLERLCGAADHQGLLAKMGPFPYATVSDLLIPGAGVPLLLVLDGIQDPFNFGAMLRSAAAFGVQGVFIGCTRQVPVTSQVARSSAGVINRIPIARVDDLGGLVDTLRKHKLRVVGTSGHAQRSLLDCDLHGPTAIIIGNEGEGVSGELLQRCDQTVSIPLQRDVESLNAAAAAAVFFYEVLRQRQGAAAPSGTRPDA